MSLSAGNYTPSSGLTPQGQQFAQGQPSATNTQAPPPSQTTPNPLTSDLASFPSDQQLSSQFQTANTNLLPFGTASGRQQYVDNSNLGSMQTNYDDLAKKLFEYDQGKLNPQMQGQNPGTASDAPAFGRVEASPLGMTEQGAALPASQGIYNPNPKYAYAAQTTQGNSLADLLGTLNKGIGDTFAARVGTYKSDKQAAQDALDSVLKVMGMKSTVAQKQAELQTQKEIESMRIGVENARLAQEKQLKLMDLGYINPLTGELYTDNNGKASLKTPQDYADSFMGGYTKWADVPNSMKIAIGNLVKKQGGNVQKVIDGYTSVDRSISILNDISEKWKSMGQTEKLLPSFIAQSIPGLAPTRTGINTLFYSTLEPELRKAAVGGRITQQEINWIRNAILPGPLDSPESAQAKLTAVKYGMEMKQKNPNYSLNDDTLKEAQSNSGTVKIQGSDGKIWDIPSSQVDTAVKRGGKVVK
jgi:hypothetical protein